ncbi:MAG: type II secretion system GspH family protein [Candidatus Gracilibacteria bacterium]|jgi:prepilin-type N-terminal cleavage/methylation domain-containing protein|nr:type II secretion system GspH family protein [Candidatus Gracilibacteria bacterium]
MHKKIQSQKGFTLIELLVVITIIGILATGTSTVYTSAQQKARDSIRQVDIMAFKGAIEQSYTDLAKYPQSANIGGDATATNCIKNATTGLVAKGYLAKFPIDPKSGEIGSDNTRFRYHYGAKKASNGIAGQLYEFSANFENQSNNNKKDEGGDDANRWEVGVGIDSVRSGTSATNPYSVILTTPIAIFE